MNFSTLAEFRRNTYACFARAADALMDVVDALLTETPARSFLGRESSCPGGGSHALRTSLQPGTWLPDGQAGFALGDAASSNPRAVRALDGCCLGGA